MHAGATHHHELLLQPHQLRVPQLHAVDLLAHLAHHVLPNVGVHGVVHLLLQHQLALPQHDLCVRACVFCVRSILHLLKDQLARSHRQNTYTHVHMHTRCRTTA